MTTVDVYLEVGSKRVFAGALGWPGWCRSGRDEPSALQALVEYGPRYAAAISKVVDGFAPAKDTKDLNLVEHLEGDATTDFGAPHVPPTMDSTPLDDRELDRLSKLLEASWQAFDSAAKAAASTTLRSGPRGGGRDVAKMQAHVLESDASYVGALGGRFRPGGHDPEADMRGVRQAFFETLAARLRGELPTVGARGGLRWSPRYAIRRSAWHALDHAWEIEDRSI